MQGVDRVFQRTFSRLFVYNILFEDAEVDERFLGVDESSQVLAISGAGCGVAGLLSHHPRSIDACDINPHHLALAALKATAAQRLHSYTTFYELLGRGWHAEPRRVLRQLAPHMPEWVARYWERHTRRFERSLYLEGMTARMLAALRRLTGISEEWLRGMLRRSVAERKAMVDATLRPVLYNPVIKALMDSPLQLVALGVNFTQRDRMLAAEDMDMTAFFLHHVKRIAETDLETNWFAWYVTGGGFNHEHPEAVPPYLRRDRHARSLGAPSQVRYFNGNIFDKLQSAPRHTWTHYTLCDAPDWMPAPVQRRLLEEILRTSKEGAIVLHRSVEEDSMVERLGYERHFRRLEATSELATRLDRTRQYRGVHFHQVCH